MMLGIYFVVVVLLLVAFRGRVEEDKKAPIFLGILFWPIVAAAYLSMAVIAIPVSIIGWIGGKVL